MDNINLQHLDISYQFLFYICLEGHTDYSAISVCLSHFQTRVPKHIAAQPKQSSSLSLMALTLTQPLV